MQNLAELFFYFLFLLAWGTFVYLPKVDSQLTGAGFPKLISITSTSLAFIASMGLGVARLDFNSYSGSALLFSILTFIVWFYHRDRRALFIKLAHLAAVACGLYFIYLIRANFLFFNISINSLILGLITYLMLLGHYYLVVPKLSERPLVVGLYYYWALLTFKILFLFPTFSPLGLWQQWGEAFLGNQTSLVVPLGIFDLALFFFQQLATYVALPILSYFVYRLSAMRSTQSATGVFYVMVFFVLISEFTTLYFLLSLGVKV